MKQILLIVILLFSCRGTETKQGVDVPVLLSEAHERVYELYSLKYDLGKDTIRDICHTYLMGAYPVEYSLITYNPLPDSVFNLRESVEKLSAKYKLSVSNVTTLLLSYENWLISYIK